MSPTLNILISLLLSLSIPALSIARETNKNNCPDSFAPFWTIFRKSVEKDRMKDIKFLTHFPVQLISADGKQIKDLGPIQFQNIFYKIMSEKCDVMDSKNQRQWILHHKEIPTKSPFFTCTKKWAQFCNFDFSFENAQWRLTKINTTQKGLFEK